MADQDLAERLESVLARELPEYRGFTSVERLSGGASQETYRIVIDTELGAQQLAMRRAPGGLTQEQIAERAASHQLQSNAPGLATEALMMASARDAGVPEPEVRYVLRDEDGLGAGFLMSWLDGEALGARIARGPQFASLREHLAYDCGRILARIHQIDLDATGLRSQLEPMTPEEFVTQTWQRYQAFDTPQPMIDYAGRWLMDHLPSAPRTALVHNDFRNGNFMVNEDEIVAVLDWEVAYIGDPMRDLGWICTNSWRFGVTELPVGGFGRYEDLFRGYEEVSGMAVDADHVKFWEVFGSFWWAVGCLGMAEHYRSGPDQTVERPAIGRRTSECQVDCVNLLIPGDTELLEPQASDNGIDMPTLDELLLSVRDFLHTDVMQSSEGRQNFLARVAGNSLDIARREVRVAPAQRAQEQSLLRDLLGIDDDLAALRWKLVQALRSGSMALDAPALTDYLRFAVVNQVAIDQPKYSGFKTALTNAGLSV